MDEGAWLAYTIEACGRKEVSSTLAALGLGTVQAPGRTSQAGSVLEVELSDTAVASVSIHLADRTTIITSSACSSIINILLGVAFVFHKGLTCCIRVEQMLALARQCYRVDCTGDDLGLVGSPVSSEMGGGWGNANY